MAALFPILLNDRLRVSMNDNPHGMPVKAPAGRVQRVLFFPLSFYLSSENLAVSDEQMAKLADFPPMAGAV